MLGTRFAVFVTADIPNVAVNVFLETSDGPSDAALRLVDHEEFLALWPHVENSPERRQDRLEMGWRSSYAGLGVEGCAAKLRAWARRQPLLNPECFFVLDKNFIEAGMVRCCRVHDSGDARPSPTTAGKAPVGANGARMHPADIATHFQGRLPHSSIYMPLPPALRPPAAKAQSVEQYLLSIALARQWPSVAKDQQLLEYMSQRPPGAFTEFPRPTWDNSPSAGGGSEMDIDEDDRAPTASNPPSSVLGKKRPISHAGSHIGSKRIQISELLDDGVSSMSMSPQSG